MREPRFWSGDLDPRSREAAPLTRALLTPAAWLYGAVTAWKMARTEPQRVGASVICVGNLTVGGVGKSPVVAAVRERLVHSSGVRVASLSRGYGGRLKGPLRVDPGLHLAADVGDEPLMLAQSGESWIAADRALGGVTMSTDGVDVIVMDDGFQNPGLAKDLSLVVIDAKAGFGNGFIVPKGPLRETPAQGLARTSAIVVMGDGPAPAQALASGLVILRARIVPDGPVPQGALVAFAGIGRPDKLFDSLTAAGADLRDAVPFADHHVYSASDLSYLRALAGTHGARLVTTQKDYCRLAPSQRGGITTLTVRAQFDEPASLDSLLAQVLKSPLT